MPNLTKANKINRATKIVELQKKVNAGKNAQLEYDKKQKEWSDLYSIFNSHRTYEPDYETQSKLNGLEKELKDLAIIIQEAKQAHKSLKRMQQTDTRNAMDADTKQRDTTRQMLLNKSAELERAIAELDTRMENRMIDLDTEHSAYTDELRNESEHEIEYMTSERDRLQSELNALTSQLHQLQHNR